VLQIVALLLRTVDLIAYASKGSTATRWHWGKVLTVEIFSHALDLMCRLVLTMAVFLGRSLLLLLLLMMMMMVLTFPPPSFCCCYLYYDYKSCKRMDHHLRTW
jgi:hypothetical protein